MGYANWPVSLLAGDKHRGAERMPQIKMKMVVRHNKEIEHKGGLEAALVSHSPRSAGGYDADVDSRIVDIELEGIIR
jgi:hypothetical protein